MSSMTAARNTDLSIWLERWDESREVSPHRAHADRTRIRKYILPYFKNRSVVRITTEDIDEWLDTLRKKGVGVSTAYASLMILRQALGMAADEIDHMAGNPAHGVSVGLPAIRQPSDDEIISAEHLQRILDAAHPDYRVLIELAAVTGAQWDEAIGLRESDIFLQSKAVSLGRWRVIEDRGRTREAEGESGDIRLVQITDELAEHLTDHLERTKDRRHKGYDWVFLTPRDARHPLRPNFTIHVWRPAVMMAGLDPKKITFHKLRHTAAVNAIKAGMSPEDLARMLGHKSVTTTRLTYQRFFDAREATRRKAAKRRRLLENGDLGPPA